LGMTVVMIEHDMGVVMDLSHRLMVLDFGRKIAEGLPEEIKANADVRRAYLGEDHGFIGAQETAEAAQ
jgi:branched-chain amino acid transport system ATP-binding protein